MKEIKTSLPQHHILIVEDDLEARTMLSDLISMVIPNASVTLSANGDDGISQVFSRQFDLICTDHKMPGTSGAGFINQTRTDKNCLNYKTPVVVVSGFMPMAKEELLFDFNNIFFLEKPYSPEKLRLTASTAAQSLETDLTSLNQKLMNTRNLAAFGDLCQEMVWELNNPISVIGGNSRIIARKLEESHPKALELVKENTGRIEQYLEKMVNISKYYQNFRTSGEEFYEPLNLSELLDGPEISCFEKAYAGQVILKKDKPDHNMNIHGSWKLLQLAFLHLINYTKDTLLKSGSGNSKEISIRARSQEKHVIVKISCHISEEKGEKATQFNSRLKNLRHLRSGLSIEEARKIIENHAGTVHFSPTEGPEEWIEIQLPAYTPS